MTNNEELALKLKAAADSATPGEWRYLKTTPFIDAEISAKNNTRVINLLAGDVTEANSEFIATANPANILALLAERDADKKRIAELTHNHRVHAARLIDERGQLKERIAELEARTVSVKFPDNTQLSEAPEHIWLQTAGEWPATGEFSELTWCSDRQHPDDTLYVRADLAAGIKLEVEE